MTDNAQIAEFLRKQNDMLASMLDGGQKTKAPAGASSYTPLHGPGGIFAVAGAEPEVITARIRPESIASRLAWLPSVYVDPRFMAYTGFTNPTGSQPANACGDAPMGYAKSCGLTARFGRIRFDTQTIDINDVMLRLHRGDFTDLRLVGQLLGMTNLVPSNVSQRDILNVVTAHEMVIASAALENELVRQVWQGVTTVANEFPGLDVQIATGQRDADTNTLCPALDSDVKNFAYDLVGGTGRNIVEYLGMLEYYLHNNARKMGLLPATWVIAMRADLWYALTEIWPCEYNTNRCSSAVNANGTVFLDGRDNIAQRDAMRRGMTLDLNGRTYDVILDDGIFEHNSTNNANLIPGEFASSIYMVPLTVQGGVAVTYMEHVDYTKAQPDVNLLNGQQTFFWTDGGKFMWTVDYHRYCYQLGIKNESRVVLRAPHLAGRIDAVKYSNLQHLRDSNPTSSYFQDGGVSLRGNLALQQPYAVWSSRR